MIDFTKMDIAAVMSGVDADGERYLSKFLKEYKTLYNEAVNPGCAKCLNGYLIKYKKIMAKKETNADNGGYVLHKKYENVLVAVDGKPSVYVNNENMTKEYGEILMGRKNGAALFAKLPEVGEVASKKEAKPKADKKTKAAPLAPSEPVETEEADATETEEAENTEAKNEDPLL